ncbi:hypothetical protein SISNIDRAFT_489124 [Sistotremastrum niveocremeum HHB9708]|uniref:Uncharacterized protein n=1 Tax=Sistotremastrum niveocremeum HHB9708 TaxID=1314777 RepID=A0A164QJH0_9AGAM|nr:hypothetical protein SISNIDRAFT_489124 [Sistotremastrum niveocremeum HHB9708]
MSIYGASYIRRTTKRAISITSSPLAAKCSSSFLENRSLRAPGNQCEVKYSPIVRISSRQPAPTDQYKGMLVSPRGYLSTRTKIFALAPSAGVNNAILKDKLTGVMRRKELSPPPITSCSMKYENRPSLARATCILDSDCELN